MEGFTFVYIPNTNPAHETGVKYDHRDDVFGLISVHDTLSPITPGEHMLTINAWQVDARGRPVTIAGAKLGIPEYIIAVPSTEFTTHVAMDHIAKAAVSLGRRLGVLNDPPSPTKPE